MNGATLFRNYVDGEWVGSNRTHENRNPADTSDLVGTLAEMTRAINIFRYFAGEGSRLPGTLVPSERQRVFMWAERKPIGVVSLIIPWNNSLSTGTSRW